MRVLSTECDADRADVDDDDSDEECDCLACSEVALGMEEAREKKLKDSAWYAKMKRVMK